MSTAYTIIIFALRMCPGFAGKYIGGLRVILILDVPTMQLPPTTLT
jgi:hypothetical protein